MTTGPSDCGQVFVVGALVLAASIVGLALVLHAGAFTDPAAVQGSASEGYDAIEFVDEAEAGLGAAVRFVNNETAFTTYEALNDSYAVESQNWTDLARSSLATSGRGVGIVPNATNNGTRISQNQSTDFSSRDGSADWNLSRGVNATRQFRMNVSADSLVERDDTFGRDAQAYRSSSYFRVNLTPENGRTRGIYLYRNATGGRVFLRVDTGGDEMSPRCSATPNDEGLLTAYLTFGRIGENLCHHLDVFDRIEGSNYTITYNESYQVSGSYELYVDANRSTVLNTTEYATDPDGVPFVERAIYAGLSRLDYAAPVARFSGWYAFEPRGPRPLDHGPPFEVTVGDFVTFQTPPLRSLRRSGAEITYEHVTGIGGGGRGGIGPTGFSLTPDPHDEFPYIHNQDVEAVNADNTWDISTSSTQARDVQTSLAVGRWKGSGPSAFYPAEPDGGNQRIVMANASGGSPNTHVVTAPADGVRGIGGLADLTGDGDREIVFVNDAGDLYYVANDTTNTVVDANANVANTSIDVPPAIGRPADFDGDGYARLPIVTSGGDVALVNMTDGMGTRETVMGGGNATRTTIATLDWDTSEPGLEIVYVDESTDELRYVTDVTGTNDVRVVRDDEGNAVIAEQQMGVR